MAATPFPAFASESSQSSDQIVNGEFFNVGPRYSQLGYLGEGAYGLVASAKDNELQQDVAIKKMALKGHMLSLSKRVLREIKILTRLDHENIIKAVDLRATVFQDGLVDEVYLVLDKMETDLYTVIKKLRSKRQLLPSGHVSFWMYSLACALNYIHSASVLHRDLKPQNILINPSSNCDLRVCDFGLARVVDPENTGKLSEYVATRWYRAPELSLSVESYSSATDVWSFGCVFAECLTGKPLFPCDTAIELLDKILSVTGSPSESELAWLRDEGLARRVMDFPARSRANFNVLFSGCPPEAMDMLERIFQFEPSKRPSAQDLLSHPYFESSGYRNPQHEVATTPLSVDELDLEDLSFQAVSQEMLSEINDFQARAQGVEAQAQR